MIHDTIFLDIHRRKIWNLPPLPAFPLLKTIIKIFHNFIDDIVIFLVHVSNQFVSVVQIVHRRVHRLYEFKQFFPSCFVKERSGLCLQLLTQGVQ